MSQTQPRPVQAESTCPDWLKAEGAIPELLATVPLFQGLDPATLAGLTNGCTLVEIPAGTRLIEEGDEGDAYYVVIKGRLQALRRAHGEEILLSEMTRGASVGEAALLGSTARTASVVAVHRRH